MRAVEIIGPDIEGLKLVERPTPKPGPGQVLLRMMAISLNYRDLITVSTPGMVKFPRIPISDGCGEVAEIGAGVTRVAVGDRVAPIFHQAWISGPATAQSRTQALGGALDGCAVDYMCLSAEGVVKVPAYLSDSEVASLPCAAVTAWNGLVVAGNLKAGDRVLVQGTGGVSIFALQIAKAMGASVFVTSSSDEKLAHAKKLGADGLINYKKTPDWEKEVLKLTNNEGVEHVIEVGGTDTFKRSLYAAAPSGHIAVIGLLTGAKQDFSVMSFISKALKMNGISVGSRDMFEEMLRAFEVNRIKPIIDSSFELENVQEAYRYLKSGAHFGKVVLKIS